MAARTRSRVAPLTASESLRTAETVALDTPADWATSLIVGRLAVIAGPEFERSNWFGAVRNGSAMQERRGGPGEVKPRGATRTRSNRSRAENWTAPYAFPRTRPRR